MLEFKKKKNTFQISSHWPGVATGELKLTNGTWVCRGLQLLTFKDDKGPHNVNFKFIWSYIFASLITNWDVENGWDEREQQVSC